MHHHGTLLAKIDFKVHPENDSDLKKENRYALFNR
jgi:hypothetical protein